MHETPPTVLETYQEQQKPEKKRRPNWKALLFVLIFFAAVLLAVFLKSPLSALSYIEVKGNHQVRYDELLRAAGLQKGMSFWKVDTDEAEAQILKTFPLVESVDVQVSWTGEAVIAIVEKSITGLVLTDKGFYRLMQDGTVLDRSESGQAEQLPVITMERAPKLTPGQKTTSADLLELLKQIPEVKREVLDQVSEIHITGDEQWQIYMRDRFEVRIPARHFADKMQDYDRFRNALGKDKAPGIINLLESNYYEPFGQQAETEREGSDA
ncbi:MAG TPA: FtsQ-type POTRA domain-containing protein [Bacilli bacterium]|nr:FtsQ-type POTRA domain-containing protein [Bacilli bacterium]